MDSKWNEEHIEVLKSLRSDCIWNDNQEGVEAIDAALKEIERLTKLLALCEERKQEYLEVIDRQWQRDNK